MVYLDNVNPHYSGTSSYSQLVPFLFSDLFFFCACERACVCVYVCDPPLGQLGSFT